jgi:hypothetical protein
MVFTTADYSKQEDKRLCKEEECNNLIGREEVIKRIK